MSLETRTETFYRCDFCGKEAKGPNIPLGWFNVQSTFAYKIQMVLRRDASPCDPPPSWHACSQCGGRLYRWLKVLGIDYAFTNPKADLAANEAVEPGSIRVGIPGPTEGLTPL